MTSKHLSNDKELSILLDIFKSIRDNTYKAQELSDNYKISQKTLYSYVNKLMDMDAIERVSKGKYQIKKIKHDFIIDTSTPNIVLDEDVIFSKIISPLLTDLSNNSYKRFAYVFLEMMNNALDHSDAGIITITIIKTFTDIECFISDNGIGIFENIQTKFNLSEKKYAILELAKGKLTTNPSKHSGEGIFFSSKIADVFYITSDALTYFADHSISDEGILFERKKDGKGTTVNFSIQKDSKRTTLMVFEKFSIGEEYMNFNKTIIPVSLLEHGVENPLFLSRSQARRLTARFDKFENVVLDFKGIDEIGQGFADELFRVFKNDHPEIMLTTINCSINVQRMIDRVANTKQ